MFCTIYLMGKKIIFFNNNVWLSIGFILAVSLASCVSNRQVLTNRNSAVDRQSQPVPTSLVVEDGVVKRGMSGRFYPTVIVGFSNGDKLIGYVHSGYKRLKENLTLSFSSNSVTFMNGRFERCSGVKDGIVTCQWTYSENGISIHAVSRVQVTGQPSRLAVADGSVKLGKRFSPLMEVHYSDGSKLEGYHHVFHPNRPNLVSMDPGIVIFENSHFEMVPNAPAGLVLCDWEFSEGDVLVMASSKLSVGDPHIFRIDHCDASGGSGKGAEISLIARCEGGSIGAEAIELLNIYFYCRPDLCELMMLLGDCCGSEKTPPPVTLEEGPPFFTFECLKKEQMVRITVDFPGDEPNVCYVTFPCSELDSMVVQIEKCCNCLM